MSCTVKQMNLSELIKCKMYWTKSTAKGCFNKRCFVLSLSHHDAQAEEGRRSGIPPALPALDLKCLQPALELSYLPLPHKSLNSTLRGSSHCSSNPLFLYFLCQGVANNNNQGVECQCILYLTRKSSAGSILRHSARGSH